jgi:hypothetical protein
MTFRAVSGHAATAESLGPLRDLVGFWEGVGFSLIARPQFDPGNEDGFFLELNLLRETIEFTAIGSPILNRGSRQADIGMYGVTYLHRVTDATTGGALHIEPGLWLNVPATAVPDAGPTIARLSTIPHGNAFCATGEAVELDVDGGMEIPPANTVPFAIGGLAPPAGTPNPYRAYDLSVACANRTSALPALITQAVIDDPNSLGRNAIAEQTLTHVTHLLTSTTSSVDIANLPFITENANTVRLDSVFSIEHVVGSGEAPEYMQLQYSQTALLEFGGMTFPHVTVGTLVKAF